MEYDPTEVPSREDLKGVIARAAGENLEPGNENHWRDVKYDMQKIDKVFESYESNNGEPLDQYAGKSPEDVPEEAQRAISTAISYASVYPDKELPMHLEEAGEDFTSLAQISAALDGMAPVGAGVLPQDEHEELYGSDPHAIEG